MIKSVDDYDIFRKEVKAATLNLIETDYYTTQNPSLFQQMKSGKKVNDYVPVRTFYGHVS